MSKIKVKPLEWKHTGHTFMQAEVEPLCIVYRINNAENGTKQLRLDWCDSQTDFLGAFNSWDEAEAAAQGDLDSRIFALVSVSK